MNFIINEEIACYKNYSSHGFILAYTKDEENVSALFKALGESEKKPNRLWSKVKAHLSKKALRPLSPEEKVKAILVEKLKSKLPLFRILTIADPTEISPLTFIAYKTKSEPLFHLLLSFADSQDLRTFFSDHFRNTHFDALSVVSIIENDKIDDLVQTAKLLKSDPSQRDFLNFKNIASRTMRGIEEERFALIQNSIGIKSLAQLIHSYVAPPFPEILL